jgi:hypothetical protein
MISGAPVSTGCATAEERVPKVRRSAVRASKELGLIINNCDDVKISY